MKVGEFGLELNVVMRIAANVASPAGASTNIMQRVFHSGHNFWMLTHAQIIVRAPHGDLFGPIMSSKAACVRIRTLVAQDVDKHAIAAFGMKPVNRLFENSIVIHGY